jgi:hypothetical protein
MLEGCKGRFEVSCLKNRTVGVVFCSLDLLEERQQGFQNMRHGVSNLPFASVSPPPWGSLTVNLLNLR